LRLSPASLATQARIHPSPIYNGDYKHEVFINVMMDALDFGWLRVYNVDKLILKENIEKLNGRQLVEDTGER
jgi:hypothetical protein